jgi:phosphotransferase system HPr (HPr) family protein
MTEKMITVGNNLEGRPAALFVQAASKYKSHIELRTDTKSINAKSIMGMFALCTFSDRLLTLVADGEDEHQAVEELSAFITKI